MPLIFAITIYMALLTYIMANKTKVKEEKYTFDEAEIYLN